MTKTVLSETKKVDGVETRVLEEKETKNGKVDSDFPVKASDKNARSKGKNKKPRANKLQGEVGDDPGTTIKVRVSNGSVEIRRER